MSSADCLPHWPDLTKEERRSIWEPLWLQGKSAGQIALHFSGATRNSVIGGISRAGLKRSIRQRGVPNPPKKRRPERRVAPQRPKPPPSAPEPQPERDSALRWLLEDRPPLPGVVPIGLLDLPNKATGVCRYPVQGGYCGLECGDAVYCRTHHRFTHGEAE